MSKPTPVLPQEIIRQKRDGFALEADTIQTFVTGITNGRISDGQIGAFAMASLIQGMNREETIALTCAMRDSGAVLTWPEIDRPILDKHSTGGVGDNVSLMLAPLLAACGAAVPMISGRGLGHTGGTLDKLDAVPGYQSEPDEALFRQTVREIGCAIIGQTSDLAPADKKLYAVRDVTATVESVPLITASILSKKLAAGLEGLVLDVKFGNGAVLKTQEEAHILAQSLVQVAQGAGLSTTAILTNMDQPLANCAGNGLEVQNAIDFLTGASQPPRLKDVILALASELLVSGGLANTLSDGVQKAQALLDNGQAAETFARMVHALGGPSDLIENTPHYLPQARFVQPILSESDGYIDQWDTREIGMAVVKMGGGRKHPNDALDYSVGLSNIQPIGTYLSKGDPIAYIHTASEADGLEAIDRVKKCLAVADSPKTMSPVIANKIVG